MKRYNAYYGYEVLHHKNGTARELFHSLKKIRNKISLLIDTLEIRNEFDLLIPLESLYTSQEIDEIYGYLTRN